MPKSKNCLTSVKNWCPQLTWKLNEAVSSKIWIQSKQMKINDVFDYFTSKAYSAATLSRTFHFYQLKVTKQLTQKLSFFSKMWYFQLSCSFHKRCYEKFQRYINTPFFVIIWSPSQNINDFQIWLFASLFKAITKSIKWSRVNAFGWLCFYHCPFFSGFNNLQKVHYRVTAFSQKLKIPSCPDFFSFSRPSGLQKV